MNKYFLVVLAALFVFIIFILFIFYQQRSSLPRHIITDGDFIIGRVGY